jgi:hypothetical protein
MQGIAEAIEGEPGDEGIINIDPAAQAGFYVLQSEVPVPGAATAADLVANINALTEQAPGFPAPMQAALLSGSGTNQLITANYLDAVYATSVIALDAHPSR